MKPITYPYPIPFTIHKYIAELRHIPCQTLYSEHAVTIRDIVIVMEWGSNKTIRSGAIRAGKEGMIKSWPKITDPHHKITESCYIAKGKADMIYLWIKEG